ncbi:MAG: Holliday junction resolvase RuvX [candidate division Zixibacteria bacterium]|nr:Holliday junction resolvase RuvX [candidate division Zixibacteria bacterium]
MNHAHNRAFLAIDYGKRRIGLAKSDPLGIIASPLATLTVSSRREAVAKVREVIAEHKPNGLVVGYPLLGSGDRSPMCEEIDRFLDDLCATWRGPVYKVDEEHSSGEATALVHAQGRKVGMDKGKVDQLAAVVILRRFLDERRQD